MGRLTPKQTLLDPLYVELHAEFADWLINNQYTGAIDGLTDEERADLRERASEVAHGIIRLSLKALGKDLHTAVADGSIYHGLVHPLPTGIDFTRFMPHPPAPLKSEVDAKDEMLSIASRLDEIATGSNMEQWIRQLADNIRSTAEAYKRG